MNVRSHRRLGCLCAPGIVLGAQLPLHQRLPAFIIQVGGMDVALEPEIAADIFVMPRRRSASAPGLTSDVRDEQSPRVSESMPCR